MAAGTATRTVPVIGAAPRLATALARVRRHRLARRPGRAANQRPAQQRVNPGRPDIVARQTSAPTSSSIRCDTPPDHRPGVLRQDGILIEMASYLLERLGLARTCLRPETTE
jgi:hypothetical protein